MSFKEKGKEKGDTIPIYLISLSFVPAFES